MAQKMDNVIRNLRKEAPGCWECSTLTEDGHRISGFGVSSKQAVYDAFKKAEVYGTYVYPHS